MLKHRPSFGQLEPWALGSVQWGEVQGAPKVELAWESNGPMPSTLDSVYQRCPCFYGMNQPCCTDMRNRWPVCTVSIFIWGCERQGSNRYFYPILMALLFCLFFLLLYRIRSVRRFVATFFLSFKSQPKLIAYNCSQHSTVTMHQALFYAVSYTHLTLPTIYSV